MSLFQLALTPAQAAFLQTYLPSSFSFQPAPLESKRPRATKKIDQSFTADFVLLPQKRLTTSALNFKVNNSQKTICNSDVDLQVEMSNPQLLKAYEQQLIKQSQEMKKNKRSELENSIHKFLSSLKNHKSSAPFRNPVDPVSQQVPNYLKIIKEPMDLKTVQRRLKSEKYESFAQFDTDIKKIISNSFTFNQVNSTCYQMTVAFEAFYNQLLKENVQLISAKILASEEEKGKKFNIQKQRTLYETPRKQGKSKKQSKNTTLPEKNRQNDMSTTPQKCRMKQLNLRERERMFCKINKLSQQSLRNFIQLCGVSTTASQWTQMQIDLAQLNEQTFMKVQTFLNEQ